MHDTIAIDDVELEIQFSYTPGRPAVMYLPNGDPGYPADPAEVDIEEIHVWGVDVTKSVPDRIYDYLKERILEMAEMGEYEPDEGY